LHKGGPKFQKPSLPRYYRKERQLAEKAGQELEKIAENAMAFQDIIENKGGYEYRHKLFQKLKLLKINELIKCLNIPGSKKKGEIFGVDAGILLITHKEKMSA
jgi:hypothetical protein